MLSEGRRRSTSFATPSLAELQTWKTVPRSHRRAQLRRHGFVLGLLVLRLKLRVRWLAAVRALA
jgi:hypothetical protein